MKIILDSNKFKDYTKIHRNEIGVDLAACSANFITGMSIVIPESKEIADGNVSLATIGLLVVGIYALVCFVIGVFRFMKNHYTSEILYKDVENMNETEHCFSLVAIKDTFNDYPNRFLLKYDKDWDCDLFFSFHTLNDEQRDIGNIKERLSNLLKVDPTEISVEYVNETLQTKFSQKDKVTKLYNHRLYHAEIKDFPKDEQKQTFEIDGIRYKWETIDTMREDVNIRQKNMDVVDFVSANIP